MKIQKKVKIAGSLTLLVPVVYYFIYAFVDLYLSRLCKTYICFEFPPFADVLAIWVALIGLYFVVTSLEAWKNQDKYQTAKNNITKVHDLLDVIKVFNQKMKNLNGIIKKDQEIGNKFPLKQEKDIEYQNAYRFYEYEQCLNDLKILDLMEDTKYAITKQSTNLYQQKFEELMAYAEDYLENIRNKMATANQEFLEKKNKAKQEIKEGIKLRDAAIQALPDGEHKDSLLKLQAINRNLKYSFGFQSDEYNKLHTMDIDQETVNEILSDENDNYHKFEKSVLNLQKILNEYVASSG